MFKFCFVFFVLVSFVASFSLNDGIFYFVGSDCYLKSSVGSDAHINTMENYQLSGSERACENIASSVYQNSKGSHLIVLKYETPKEISILIQKIDESTNLNLKDSFKKVNYEYILGDYCIFDKTLLSIGIDSNMLYTTVKCGDGANEIWAFMRSILSENGDFYTPSGPLIFFKNGDPSFNQLLFISTNDLLSADTVVVRYNWALDGTFRFFLTYLHEINKTSTVIKSLNLLSTKGNIFSTSMGITALFQELNGTTEITIYDTSENPVLTFSNPKFQKRIHTNYGVFRAWGFYSKLGYQKSEIITWKIRDTERIENFETEECNLSDKNGQCSDTTTDDGSTHWSFYLMAGIEFIIFVAAFATLITLIFLKRKKRISKVVSKRDGPAVTQIATVYSTQMDDVSNTTNTNNP